MRVEDSIKRDADALFSDLVLDTPTAIRIFLKQALKQETMTAIEEVERMKAGPSIGKIYTSVDERMEEVLA